MGLTIQEKISRAKIQIQNKNSFFAYLSLYLKFQEIKKGIMPADTMGIDCNGNISYVKEYIEEITKNGDTEQLEGLIAHEICHLVFLTELREENRDRTGWNFSSDLAINTLLKNNGFKLPEGGMIPDHYDKFKIGKKEIKDVSKLTAEEIYDMIPQITSKNCKYVIASGSDKGTELGKIIDNHIKGKNGKPLTKKEKETLIRDWSNKIQEALTISKMKGDTPNGLEQLMGKLHEEKVDWRTMLMRYIQNSLPSDFCLDKDTLINTPKGKVKIKDLKIGDEVLGYKDGKIVPNRILNKFDSQIKKKYIIYTKSGKRIICSQNHKFLTVKGYVKAKDLSIGKVLLTI